MRDDRNPGGGAFVLGGVLLAVLLAGAALLLALTPAAPAGATDRVQHQKASTGSGCADGSDGVGLFGLVCP